MSVTKYLNKVEKGIVPINEFIEIVDKGIINPEEVIIYLNS